MSKSDQYFPHDYNAFSDPKISAFISDYGITGYGFYWIVIELLHKEDSCMLPKKDYIFKALAKQMLTSVEQIKEYVEQATYCELFVKNDEYIISERVLKNRKKRQELSEKRSEAGKISAIKRTSVEQMLTSVEQNSTNKKKRKEIIIDKENDIKESSPSVEDGYKAFIDFAIEYFEGAKEDYDQNRLKLEAEEFAEYWFKPRKAGNKTEWEKKKYTDLRATVRNRFSDRVGKIRLYTVRKPAEPDCPKSWQEILSKVKPSTYNYLQHQSQIGKFENKTLQEIWNIAKSKDRG